MGMIPRKFKKFEADILSLRRLKGLSLSRQARYLAIALCGETLRTRTFGAVGLRLVEISLTDRCQCRCVHCFAATQNPLPRSSELTTDEVQSLIEDLVQAGATEVCFSGGEPLLRDDLVTLVGHAHAQGLVVRLITNGILLDRSMVVELKRAGLNWCSVSLDSPIPEEHDSFRGYSGCYAKAVEGLALLVQNRLPCSIITVARKELLYSGQLEELVRLGKSIGVTVVRINFPVPIGRLASCDEQTLNFKEREEVRKLLDCGYVTMESPYEGTSCTAAVTKINILADGSVTPCVFVPIPYGNIREHKFAEIWKDMAQYSRRFKASGQCPMCDPVLREAVFRAAGEQRLQAGAPAAASAAATPVRA